MVTLFRLWRLGDTSRHHPDAKGFTLIELLGVVALMSVLASVMGPVLVNMQMQRANQSVIDMASEQMTRLAQAAQRHALDNTGTWPGQASSCSNAYTTLNSAGRIPGIPSTDPWGNAWAFWCVSEGNFEVRARADNNNNARLVAANVTGAVVSGQDVKGSWPRPSAIPALTSLLPLDGSRDMTGNLNMNNQRIQNANEIITEGLSITKQIMPQFVQMDSVSFGLDSYINKPACGAGGSPRIVLAVHGIKTDYIFNYGEMAYAVDYGLTWRITPYASWNSRVVGIANTYCYYPSVSGR